MMLCVVIQIPTVRQSCLTVSLFFSKGGTKLSGTLVNMLRMSIVEWCASPHTEYYGNACSLAIYQFSTSDQATSSQICLETDVDKFTLVTKFKNRVTQGPTAVALKVVEVERVIQDVLWTMLSVRFVLTFFSLDDWWLRLPHLGLSSIITIDVILTAVVAHSLRFFVYS